MWVCSTLHTWWCSVAQSDMRGLSMLLQLIIRIQDAFKDSQTLLLLLVLDAAVLVRAG